MSNDSDGFRRQADESRQQAEKAISPLDKEAWLRVAEEWLKLAQATERREGNAASVAAFFISRTNLGSIVDGAGQ